MRGAHRSARTVEYRSVAQRPVEWHRIERVEGIQDFAALHFAQRITRGELVTGTSLLRDFGDR